MRLRKNSLLHVLGKLFTIPSCDNFANSDISRNFFHPSRPRFFYSDKASRLTGLFTEILTVNDSRTVLSVLNK